MMLTGATSVNDAATILSTNTTATIAITLGKEGTMLVHQQNKIIVPGITVKSIDSTGAGDAFVGAILYQLNNYSSSI